MSGAWTVIKVGGSLLEGGGLRDFLHSLVTHAKPPYAVVPGGGVFADAVRTAQATLGFDDRHAHRLALDAMGQMAETFAVLEPRLQVVGAPDDFGPVAASGRVPVWTPAALRGGHPAVPESWAVTSDSLALWLAATLDAGSAILVKSIDPPPGWTVRELAARGIVDAAFPGFAARFGGSVDVVGPRRWAEIASPRSSAA
jgi:aspartokinase-like uncharacterized kinase